jgi:hypothetical protein
MYNYLFTHLYSYDSLNAAASGSHYTALNGTVINER